MELAKYKGRKNLNVIQKGGVWLLSVYKTQPKVRTGKESAKDEGGCKENTQQKNAERPPRQQKIILGRNSCDRMEKGRLRWKNIAVSYLYWLHGGVLK